LPDTEHDLPIQRVTGNNTASAAKPDRPADDRTAPAAE